MNFTRKDSIFYSWCLLFVLFNIWAIKHNVSQSAFFGIIPLLLLITIKISSARFARWLEIPLWKI